MPVLVEDQDFTSSPAVIGPEPPGPAIYSISGAVVDDVVEDIPIHLLGIGVSAPPRPYIVSGRVIAGTGDPLIEGVLIYLNTTPLRTTVTKADGTYQFDGVPNGVYYLSAVLAAHTITGSGYVGVKDQNVSGFDFTASFTSGSPINGTVSGAIVAGVTINYDGPVSGSLVLDSTGYYSISPMARPGIYMITPSYPGYSFNPASRLVTLSNVSGVAAGTNMNFTSALGEVVPSTYSANVNVTGLQGVSVVWTKASDGTTAATAVTASNGVAVTSLPNGSYVATPTLQGYRFNPSQRGIVINNVGGGVNVFTPIAE